MTNLDRSCNDSGGGYSGVHRSRMRLTMRQSGGGVDCRANRSGHVACCERNEGVRELAFVEKVLRNVNWRRLPLPTL